MSTRPGGSDRRTFDLGVGPWGGTPWPGIPSFVVTHRARPDPLGDSGGKFAFDGLEAAVRHPLLYLLYSPRA